MNKFKDFLKTRKGKTIIITAAAFVVCIAVLLIIFFNRPIAVKATVKPVDNYATAVNLNKTTLELKTGDHDSLTAEVVPTNAKDKTVKWTSSDKSVATVSDGLITAQGEGTAEIIASSINGKTGSCSVTVSELSTTTSSTDTSSAGSSSTPSSIAENNSGSTKPTAPAKGGGKKGGGKKPITPPQGGKGDEEPKKKTDASTTTKEPLNKEFYKTVEGCNIEYNPSYRSAQVFVDVTGIAKDCHGEDLIVKAKKDGVYSPDDSGDCGFIGSNSTTIDEIVATNEKWVGNVPYALKTSFILECYHNNTWFKTISFTVDENGFC